MVFVYSVILNQLLLTKAFIWLILLISTLILQQNEKIADRLASWKYKFLFTDKIFIIQIIFLIFLFKSNYEAFSDRLNLMKNNWIKNKLLKYKLSKFYKKIIQKNFVTNYF